MLTARDEEPDRIVGLEVGADDYLTKPFSPRELVARMKAIFRRTEPQDHASRSRSATSCSTANPTTSRSTGKPVELTAKEFDLLAFFMANPGVVVSRDVLLDRVWGQEYPGGTRTVDVHVAQLRRKLGRPDLIRTLRGDRLQGRPSDGRLREEPPGAAVRGDAGSARAHAGADDRDRRRADPPPGRRSQAANLARRADDLALQRRAERQLQDAEHALGQRADHDRARVRSSRRSSRT